MMDDYLMAVRLPYCGSTEIFAAVGWLEAAQAFLRLYKPWKLPDDSFLCLVCSIHHDVCRQLGDVPAPNYNPASARPAPFQRRGPLALDYK